RMDGACTQYRDAIENRMPAFGEDRHLSTHRLPDADTRQHRERRNTFRERSVAKPSTDFLDGNAIGVSQHRKVDARRVRLRTLADADVIAGHEYDPVGLMES